MFKAVFKFVIALTVLLVGYNFFFGTPQEKESSRKVVSQVGDLSASIFELLKSEKEKYDHGKYDAALSQLRSVIGLQSDRATSQQHHQCVSECEHLRDEERAIEQRLKEIQGYQWSNQSERDTAYQTIRQQILELTRKTQSITDELIHSPEHE